MSKLNKKNYAVIGIKSVSSNWNADFEGRPQTLPDGTIVASDKALKYSIRRYLEEIGKKVLILKSFKTVKGELMPRSLEERYNFITNTEIAKETTTLDILENIFSCDDIIQFGVAFPITNHNISITGAVQITEGFNKNKDAEIVDFSILSPFQNSKKEDAKNSTMGSRTVTDYASYAYTISINPNNYNNYIGVLEKFEGYKQEDYEVLKDACLKCATNLNSASKRGCENEYAIFVECKDGTNAIMANLHEYIDYEMIDEKAELNLNRLFDYLKDYEDMIDVVEIYINPYVIGLANKEVLKELNTKVFNIINKREIEKRD
ncbi:type I CRISPR-associated protein Cas7 [Alkaliphilus sp. B6464]|uniref:type I CRISPR-associated protein Cas7 n=1 Tax=Alkaliphilus sp. B6464 TaxID=2731219 RepID=UPI001BADAC66|nr:type I CRISPR-associated protein Cas7 [Alkaliphilus sp. B6464]QUH21808.1 type I CRISPR-associated protein Cas7 [Alkaliphilus sp. B6464]